MSCPYLKQCGFCRINVPYENQTGEKLSRMQRLLEPYAPVTEIAVMDEPLRYRSKVTASFSYGPKKSLIAGHYEEGTRSVIKADSCLIENEKAERIIRDFTALASSFRLSAYDARTGQGLLRHLQLRLSESTGQIMVTVVTASPVFPSRANFCRALIKQHPEITTVVQSINSRQGSMVLGDRFQTLYGPGYIEDELLGLRFRIAPASFYQVNARMTPVLYRTALDFAGLSGRERVIDAYCGTGTIGLCAASSAREVIGLELNREAVRDAVQNARQNRIQNARFLCRDAGEALQDLALSGETADVIFMDPPRSGSSESFLSACLRLAPARIVYVSCGPESLARDLERLCLGGYRVEKVKLVDMFPHTEHVETVVLLSRA